MSPSRSIKTGLAGLALLAALPLRAEVTFAEELFPELGPLLELAVREGTAFKLGDLRLEEREGDVEVARGQGLPQVRINSRVLGSYEIREDMDDEFRGAVDGGLYLTQPLYYWGNIERRKEIARQRLELQQTDEQAGAASQFMGIRRAYLEWLLMRERRAILEQSITLSQSYVAAKRRLMEAGQSSEQDVLEMEARLLENQEYLAWVGTQIAGREAALARLVGPSLQGGSLAGASLAAIQPMGEAAYAALAAQVAGSAQLADGPAVERFSALEAIEQAQVDSLDRNNWPMLDLVSGIATDQIDSINQDPIYRVRSFVGLQVNWNLFDGWQTDGWKRSALARKRAYAAQKQLAVTESRQRAEALLSELALNLRQMEARGKRTAILERRLELLRQQAEEASVTGVTLIEAEIEHLDVRQRLMEARVNYLLNLMELGVLLGKDPMANLYPSRS